MPLIRLKANGSDCSKSNNTSNDEDTMEYTDLDVSYRILLGPGPSMASPRVLRAMATPLVGHLDPDFLEVLNEEQRLLRSLFQTENELTLSIQGTGMAGMEAVTRLPTIRTRTSSNTSPERVRSSNTPGRKASTSARRTNPANPMRPLRAVAATAG